MSECIQHSGEETHGGRGTWPLGTFIYTVIVCEASDVASCSTVAVGSHLSEHTGTEGRWITEVFR